MVQNKNLLSELLVMASLQEDVDTHREYKGAATDKGRRFGFQFKHKNNLYTIQYWKENGDLTFICGAKHERDPKLGTLVSVITFQDLVELLS